MIFQLNQHNRLDSGFPMVFLKSVVDSDFLLKMSMPIQIYSEVIIFQKLKLFSYVGHLKKALYFLTKPRHPY